MLKDKAFWWSKRAQAIWLLLALQLVWGPISLASFTTARAHLSQEGSLWHGASFAWSTLPCTFHMAYFTRFQPKVASSERLHQSLHQTQIRILLLFSLMQSQIKGPASQEGWLGDQSIKVPDMTQEWVLQTEDNMYLSKLFPSDKVLVFLFTVKRASDRKLMTGPPAEPINSCRITKQNSATELPLSVLILWWSELLTTYFSNWK